MSLHGIVRAVTLPWAEARVRRHIGTITGVENLPADGAFVLAPNHTSYFDHFLAGMIVDYVCGVPTWILTKAESFRHLPRRVWTKAWYGIPVDRDAPSPSVIRAVQHVISSGHVLGVYPEGTRGPGDELLPFRAGAFRFALKNGVPVIPMAIVGAHRVLPPGSLRFRAGRVDFSIGPAIWPQPGLSKDAQAADLSARTRAELERLLGQAKNAPSVDAIADANARAIDTLIVRHLDDRGRLERAWLRRIGAYLTLASATASDHPGLRAQQIRLEGLSASSGIGILRLPRALLVRRAAERLVSHHPTEPTAHYVLGRWHLLAPSALGARPARALEHFRIATAHSDPNDTRAASAVGETLEHLGRVDEAADAYRAVIARASGEPRAVARAARLARRLDALERVDA
jgi:1-acyl-sn-glycerol-3-phosphate acyltransferase